ncbi:MAG: hypothetical protein ACKO24_06735 [Leptolyngbyaceae cyanobacterium]
MHYQTEQAGFLPDATAMMPFPTRRWKLYGAVLALKSSDRCFKSLVCGYDWWAVPTTLLASEF